MTVSIRFIENTVNADVNSIKVSSRGNDYQLISIVVVRTLEIAAGTNTNILKWEGAGVIKAIASHLLQRNNATIIVSDVLNPNRITLDATRKIINYAVPNDGVAIPANSHFRLLLIIGDY
jgi:hypothetical protein